MIKKYKFKNYISELKEELRQALISSNSRVILKAPTGGGKTKAILELFKELSSLNKKHAYILATPNRSQSQQNVKYDVVAVVGGVKIFELTTDELLTTSCVYDKVDMLINECHMRNLEITLVIDEAHELIYSYPYRKASIENIINNLDECKTVVYMTATADVLINNKDIFKYDSIIDCESYERTANAKELNIIQYDKSNLEALILTAIQSGMNYKHILVRCNDISIIGSLSAKLSNEGIESCYIDSKNKNKSEAYNFIINDGSISDKYKVIFVTSLMDSGVSLLNDANTFCLYACRPMEFNLNSIEQFSNRCRNKYEKFILLVNQNIAFNKMSLEKREKITIDFCRDTLNALLANDYTVKSAADSVLAMLNKALDNPEGRFISYVQIDDKTGEISIDEYLKAAYVENQIFVKVLNCLKPIVLRLNGANVEITDFKDDFLNDIFSRFKRMADKITIKTIKDLGVDEELKEEIKAAKKEIKAAKEEQYMYLISKISEVIALFDSFGLNTQNSYAVKILDWLDDPQFLPRIRGLNMYGKQLEPIWLDIEDNVSNAIISDVVSRIRVMFSLCVSQEYMVLKKVTSIKKKSDLTGLLRQIQMINFNVNYNLANKDYIKKYSIEFYDLFLIRNRIDKLVQKAKLSDKLLQKLSTELSEKDSNGNVVKAYGIKKLKNTLNLLYNINKNNQFTSVKLKLK